jgi:hypothetical protein
VRRPGAAFLLFALAGCGGAGERTMSADEVAAELSHLRIAPGQWETTSAVTAASGPNMPVNVRTEMLRHRRVASNCITPAQAAHPAANFLQMQTGNACTYADFSVAGGRMRGTMRCTGGGMPGLMTTMIEGHYSPTSVDIVMRMAATGQPRGADATIATRTISRRIGPCPPARTQLQEGATP